MWHSKMVAARTTRDHEASAPKIGPIIETLQINNNIAAVSLAFNILAAIFACITVYGVYVTWQIHRSQQKLSDREMISSCGSIVHSLRQ